MTSELNDKSSDWQGHKISSLNLEFTKIQGSRYAWHMASFQGIPVPCSAASTM